MAHNPVARSSARSAVSGICKALPPEDCSYTLPTWRGLLHSSYLAGGLNSPAALPSVVSFLLPDLCGIAWPASASYRVFLPLTPSSAELTDPAAEESHICETLVFLGGACDFAWGSLRVIFPPLGADLLVRDHNSSL